MNLKLGTHVAILDEGDKCTHCDVVFDDDMIECDCCVKRFHLGCIDVDLDLPFWHCEECLKILD